MLINPFVSHIDLFRGGLMKLEQFAMERMQSTWENVVRYNLSESGVHPAAIGDLIPDEEDRKALISVELGYGQSNGTPELRRAIASMYEGAAEENVLVTTGTSEANFLVSWMLADTGREVVMMLPNYMQMWGLVRSFGAEVKPFHLIEERDWSPDLDELDRAVSEKTELIAVCNPNNPTGAILTEEEMNRIVEAARRADAWLMVDEVYRGAERSGDLTPSFWGRYDKLIITSGLSKAYGLPGLRIGWIVTTADLAARAWSYHDYTTIGPPMASDLLACVALRPENRQKLFDRTRAILNSNYPIIRKWVDSHDGLFSMIDSRAGAIAYMRYDLDVNSLKLVDALRQSRSVLIVPGEHFLMGNYLRISYGPDPEYLRAGLELTSDFISKLQ